MFTLQDLPEKIYKKIYIYYGSNWVQIISSCGVLLFFVSVIIFVCVVDEKVQTLENELKNANDLLEAARQRG